MRCCCCSPSLYWVALFNGPVYRMNKINKNYLRLRAVFFKLANVRDSSEKLQVL